MHFLYYKYKKRDKTYYKILGVPVASTQTTDTCTKYRFLCFRWIKYNMKDVLTISELQRSISQRATVLFLDHALGGGTDFYFANQKDTLLPQVNILRLQCIEHKCYRFTLYETSQTRQLFCKSFRKVKKILLSLNLKQIVVNNLVSYGNLPDWLNFITELKQDLNATISFRLHDFYAVCPFSYNLMCEDHFCEGPQEIICTKCPYTQTAPKLHEFTKWRNMWNDFLQKTADEIIVFSKSSANLLQKAYPFLTTKIYTRPHCVPQQRTVTVPVHAGTNITVLGNIVNVAKGMKLINQLEECISQNPNIHLTIIGTYPKNFDKTIVTGPYHREDLPALLEKYKTDIILIPSVCPETFSYTTSEAILSGLPVACFNIGAQAEKVQDYSLGLILSEINANMALQEIITFINKHTF